MERDTSPHPRPLAIGIQSSGGDRGTDKVICMADYTTISVNPETVSEIEQFKEDYFGTRRTPHGEALKALLSEYYGEN